MSAKTYKVQDGLASVPGSHIRFRGQWLKAAGFHPGMLFEVRNPSACVLELRVSSPAQLKAEDFQRVADGLDAANRRFDSAREVQI